MNLIHLYRAPALSDSEARALLADARAHVVRRHRSARDRDLLQRPHRRGAHGGGRARAALASERDVRAGPVR